jgi:hypothetical protein
MWIRGKVRKREVQRYYTQLISDFPSGATGALGYFDGIFGNMGDGKHECLLRLQNIKHLNSKKGKFRITNKKVNK